MVAPVIPVLGLPLLNRADLAAGMLDSVTVEVGETLVILNGEPQESREQLASWDATFIEPGCNLGVAASWNHVMRARPAAPWWFIVNADITFGRGDLERVCESMEDPDPRLVCLYEFGAFAINQAAVDTVGWFDENFHPIYFEDNDYRRRCHLAGVPIWNPISRTRHLNSATIASGYEDRNAVTFPRNADYYAAKWGGLPGHETVDAPRTPVLDRRRLVDNAWT
jgi:GT2 family glycosyltransferase